MFALKDSQTNSNNSQIYSVLEIFLFDIRLQKLNLSCNKISSVPHLRLMAAHRHFSMSTCADINSHTRMQYQTPESTDKDLSQNIAEEETTAVEVPSVRRLMSA